MIFHYLGKKKKKPVKILKEETIKKRTRYATGSALSPITANLFIEHLEKDAMDSFSYKLKV